MHAPGHFGIALAVWAPAGFALIVRGSPWLAATGALVAISLGLLPDIDEYTPMVHRGITHTVWFVLVAAITTAVVGMVMAPGTPLAVGLVTGGAALLSSGTHILADSLTPMGIWPFRPLSDRHYSFDVFASRDVRANAAAVVLGVVSWVPAVIVLSLP